MRIPALLSLLILCSCQGMGASASNPGTLRFSVKRNRVDPKAKPHYVVEAVLNVESHILAVYDTAWATLTLGEAAEGGKDIEIAREADDPLPGEVGLFTGRILAVRCKEDADNRVAVDFRVYKVRQGHIVAKKRSKDSLAEGETKELQLPW